MTTSTRLLPNAIQFPEFLAGFTSTCGETALTGAMVCATPLVETKAQAEALMLSLTHQMISLGDASASGATTTEQLRAEAVRRGFTPAPGFVSFQQPLDPATLHPYLLANAGVFPIVLEIANGQALQGDEVGLHYHFICVVGINPSGYQCIDGDNPSAGLVTYSWATLEAAIPCGLLGIEMQQQQKATTMTVPTGWKDNGTLLTAPNGLTVGTGFRTYILGNAWNAEDVPVGPETDVAEVELANPVHGAGTVQYFRYSALIWSRGEDKVFLSWVGREAMTMREMLAQKEAEIAALQKQVAAIPAPVAPAPAPLDPSVKNALAAALQLLQPQATLAAEIKSALATLG